MNAAGFAEAVVDAVIPSDRDRAITVARVILRAPNVDRDSEVALLAREFLRALSLKP